MCVSGNDDWLVAQQFLGREAKYLDTRSWDEWLSLYLPDSEYWIPAWRTDGTLVEDPQRELSLIWYPNRIGLEGRVYRLRTQRASSASPTVRTSHLAQPLSVERNADGDIELRSSWTASTVLEGRVATYFGHADYILRQGDGGWCIARKKTVILNDMIHEVVDFYNV
jgi:benzoate/toluate 1,2-dioxygenase beta subunit